MKTYRYLYYNLYRIWLRKKNETAGAHINAVITITFFLYLNLLNIPLILLAVFKRDIIYIPDEVDTNVKIHIIAFLIATGILNYMLLGRKKQHDKIVEEFKDQSEEKRKRGMLFTILFLIVSVGIPFYISFFVKPMIQ